MIYNPELVRKNMKFMRNLYGISQSEIGEILNITQHGISQYENGQRQLNYESIQILANYFRIPIEQFVKEDLSKIIVLNSSADINSINDFFETIFPIFSSPKISTDKNFKKGYDMLMNIIQASKTMQFISTEYIYSCIEFFIESYNNNQTLESIANAIGLMILVLVPAYDEEKQNIATALQKEKTINKKFIKNHILRKDYIEDPLKEEFIKEFGSFIIEYIRFLKKSPKWSDLGDYYLAISYIMDAIDNNYDTDMNTLIGEEIMNTLIKLKNKYAISYWKKKYGLKNK